MGDDELLRAAAGSAGMRSKARMYSWPTSHPGVEHSIDTTRGLLVSRCSGIGDRQQ
jgi:hypothetical protein